MLISGLFRSVAISCLAWRAYCATVILQEVEHHASLNKRDGSALLALQSAETFLWTAAESSLNSLVGNLTVLMPGDDENILSFGAIRDLTSAISCTETAIDIVFKDTGAFGTAEALWKWVNQEFNNTFALVMDGGDCPFSASRFPFVVTNLETDLRSLTTHLIGSISSWSDVAHSVELTLGSMLGQSLKVRKRFGEINYNKNITVDFNHQFPDPAFNLTDTDVEASMSCSGCGTTGSFDLSFQLKTQFFIPTDASLTLQANKVGVTANPAVGISATLHAPKSLDIPFPDVDIASISIPNLLTIGPVISTGMGLLAGPLTGSSHISGKASISLPDSASVTIDLEKGHFDHTDWSPQYEAAFLVDGGISGNLSAYARASVAIKAQVLNLGYQAEVKLQPYVKGALSTITNPAGACPNDEAHHQDGVEIDSSIGVSLIAAIEPVNKVNQPIAAFTIADLDFPLPTGCAGFGEPASSGAPIPSMEPQSTAAVVNAVINPVASVTELAGRQMMNLARGFGN